jgi:hypothetical protein
MGNQGISRYVIFLIQLVSDTIICFDPGIPKKLLNDVASYADTAFCAQNPKRYIVIAQGVFVCK